MTHTPPQYRVGTKVGRTIYRGDELIGVMDTRELASEFVMAANSASELLEACKLKDAEIADLKESLRFYIKAKPLRHSSKGEAE